MPEGVGTSSERKLNRLHYFSLPSHFPSVRHSLPVLIVCYNRMSLDMESLDMESQLLMPSGFMFDRMLQEICNRPLPTGPSPTAVLFDAMLRDICQIEHHPSQIQPQADNTPCVICLEPVSETTKIFLSCCKQCLHIACLQDWAKRKAVCPLCRGKPLSP
jgi:hypothetical protein